MKKFFKANAARAKPRNCIATLNDGMQILLKDPKQKVAGSVDETATLPQSSGHAGAVETVEFNDAKGRATKGTLAPKKLGESVWDKVISMASGDQGWSVFIMSLMDGYHSVTLSLDNTDPAHPKIYWSDQWGEKGGFKIFGKTGLDAEIEQLTVRWWHSEADPDGQGESFKKTGKHIKMNTLVRLYRVSGTPRPVVAPVAPPPWTPAP